MNIETIIKLLDAGYTKDEIMKMNIDKLKARYPEGFDIDRANHKEKYDV